MVTRLLIPLAVLATILASAPASAQALKTSSVCNAEYKAQKPALKAAKETKKVFLAACRSLPPGTPTPVGAATATAAPAAAPPAASTGSALKTTAACDAEYKVDRAALKAAKEKKKDFVAACRALPPGTATPIGTAAATPAAPPLQASPPAAPQQVANSPQAPAPTRPATRGAAPASTVTPNGANQFAAEAGAKARCPAATVVWVNTASKVYHFAGTKNYGTTKAGAYMCEGDATAAGDHVSKTERHP